MTPGTIILNDSRDSGTGQLSAGQLSILRSMFGGKTNHDLTTEMGFLIPTNRHATLSAGDRKEAARKALALILV